MGEGSKETEGGVVLCRESMFFLNVKPGNARYMCTIPLSTSDGVCVCGWARCCRNPSVQYIWQLKGSWRTGCTNDLTLPFQPVKTSCFGRRHTLSVRLICFPGV